MSQLFLLSNQVHNKMLKFIEQFISKHGLDCKILKDQADAIKQIQKCFQMEERSVPVVKKIRINGYMLNPEKRILKYKGTMVFFRKKEFELLHFMFINKGTVIDRNTILERVWRFGSNPFTNTVDVHMSHLRRKLAKNNINIIKTVHGAGYKLEV